jgi:hypothetical protein
MTPRIMPADFARCSGRVLVGEHPHVCPVRDQCLRFTSPPHDELRFRQVWCHIIGEENLEKCVTFVNARTP